MALTTPAARLCGQKKIEEMKSREKGKKEKTSHA